MKTLFVKGKKEILHPDKSGLGMTFLSCHCEAEKVSRSNLVEGQGLLRSARNDIRRKALNGMEMA